MFRFLVSKKILRLIVFSFSFIILNQTFSEVFKFQYDTGAKQRIEATIQGKILLNDQLNSKYVQNYKTIRTFKDYKNDICEIEDTYYFYQTITFNNNSIQQLNDIVLSNYTKDIQGLITLYSNSIYPTYRDIPVFPKEDIKPGHKWTSRGIEVQDLFLDKVISTFPVQENYTFIGYEELNGKKTAKFSYEHKIDIINKNNLKIDSRIQRVVGESKTILYFDNINGTQVKEQYNRDYSFLIVMNGTQVVYEFVDNGERIWYPIELMDKDKIVNDLKQKLKDDNVKDTDVTKDDKGIKISLENIHFYPDSPELLPGELDRLKKIADILRKYKERGVMIIGHTTDKGSEEGRTKLSVERAKVVLNFLITENAINSGKSSFTGKGGTEPVADNSTEEGMKKNRRVEIYILEE